MMTQLMMKRGLIEMGCPELNYLDNCRDCRKYMKDCDGEIEKE